MKTEVSFETDRKREYYIHHSPSLKIKLFQKQKRVLSTCSYLWEQTSYEQMMRKLMSISVDEKYGNENEIRSFQLFNDFRVMRKDQVNITNLVFVLGNKDLLKIKEVKQAICSFIFDRKYSWCLDSNANLSEEIKLLIL